MTSPQFVRSTPLAASASSVAPSAEEREAIVQEAARRKASKRLRSLDALRGLNMLCIIGLATLIVQCCNVQYDRLKTRYEEQNAKSIAVESTENAQTAEAAPTGEDATSTENAQTAEQPAEASTADAAPVAAQTAVVPFEETPAAKRIEAIKGQMEHVEWNGIKHHDTIFPLFLFLAGVSFPFSLAKQRANGRPLWRILLKIFWRGFALFALGIIYSNRVSFDPSEWRVMGVLQHIGLAWFFAALIYLATRDRFKTRIAIVVVVLVGYWLALALIPSPTYVDENGDVVPTKAEVFTPGAFKERMLYLLTPEKSESIQFNLSPEGCVVNWIDRKFVPGKLYHTTRDPEGLASTFPAIITALLGMMFGGILRRDDGDYSPYKKVVVLIGWGAVLVGIGLLWDKVFPINKNLWNSSFVCFVGGCSAIALGVFYLIIDVWKFRWWAFPFVVVGMNSITIYMAKRIVDFSNMRDFFFADGIDRFVPETYQGIATTCAGLIVSWVFLFWLWRKKIFLRV